MVGGNASAAETLTVSPLPAPLDFGRIVLASGASASINVNQTSGSVTVVFGPALLLPAVKTISMPTVTVGCVDAGGNGCKNSTHTIIISPGPNVQGRSIAISSLTITTPLVSAVGGGTATLQGGVVNNGSTSVSFKVDSPNGGGANGWTATFKVGMTYTISGTSPLQTQWQYRIDNTKDP